MTSDELTEPRIPVALKRLVLAEDASALSLAERLLGESLFGIRAIISLPVFENMTRLPPFSISPLLSTQHIVSYFQYPYLYFVYHDRLEPARITVDYTASFDTNYASYVKRIVASRSLDGLDKRVLNTMDKILRGNVNFDFFFYFVENFKLALPSISAFRTHSSVRKEDFWESLNRQFRDNIVALHEFKDVDCRRYLETGRLSFDVDADKAYEDSVEFTYNFYVGEGRQLANMFLDIQRIIVLQMLAMYRIQHSSRRSAGHKLAAFMEFVQDKGVLILERELIAVYSYFKDCESVPLFNRVNVGGNQDRLLEKIDNIAWDMLAARFSERMLSMEQGDFTIPLFVSSDADLLKYLRLFPLKATVVHRPSGNVISIPATLTEQYFEREGSVDIVKPYLAEESRQARSSNFTISAEALTERINVEHGVLLSVLKGGR